MIESPDNPDARPAALSDDELVDAYEETDGAPGDAAADALLAEIHERDLDV